MAKAYAIAMDRRHTRPPRRAREILKHYLENPHTVDTLEGIAAWRLIEDIVRTRVREIDEALEWLVTRGYLDRRVPMAAPPVYRLNERRRAEAERLVGKVRKSNRAGKRRRRSV